MTTIIAGRFDTSEQSTRATAELEARAIPASDISVFFVTPPGQHDATPIGGDQQVSAGTEQAPEGAAIGAGAGAAVGAAGAAAIALTAGLAAPVVAAAAASVTLAGAFGGSLVGALQATHATNPRAIRHAGMVVAVRLGDAVESDVVAVLRAAGAVDIERADGHWVDGQWTDFDPTTAPRLA